jgi:hypothetical protein
VVRSRVAERQRAQACELLGNDRIGHTVGGSGSEVADGGCRTAAVAATITSEAATEQRDPVQAEALTTREAGAARKPPFRI